MAVLDLFRICIPFNKWNRFLSPNPIMLKKDDDELTEEDGCFFYICLGKSDKYMNWYDLRIVLFEHITFEFTLQLYDFRQIPSYDYRFSVV